MFPEVRRTPPKWNTSIGIPSNLPAGFGMSQYHWCMLANIMEQNMSYTEDVTQLIRLGLTGQVDDIRIYAMRLARKYRLRNPDLAEAVSSLLDENRQAEKNGPVRKVISQSQTDHTISAPIQRVFEVVEKPLLSEENDQLLAELIDERKNGPVDGEGSIPHLVGYIYGPPRCRKNNECHLALLRA